MKTKPVRVTIKVTPSARGVLECFCNSMHRRLQPGGHVGGQSSADIFEIYAFVPSLEWMRDCVDELSETLRARGLDHTTLVFPDMRETALPLEPMLSAQLTRRYMLSCPPETFLVSNIGWSPWAPTYAAELSDDDTRLAQWSEARRLGVAQRACMLFSTRSAWRDWAQKTFVQPPWSQNPCLKR